MSVITQYEDSALMMAARVGRTEVVPLILEAGANTDLQNEVKCKRRCGLGGSVIARLLLQKVCPLCSFKSSNLIGLRIC